MAAASEELVDLAEFNLDNYDSESSDAAGWQVLELEAELAQQSDAAMEASYAADEGEVLMIGDTDLILCAAIVDGLLAKVVQHVCQMGARPVATTRSRWQPLFLSSWLLSS